MSAIGIIVISSVILMTGGMIAGYAGLGKPK